MQAEVSVLPVVEPRAQKSANGQKTASTKTYSLNVRSSSIYNPISNQKRLHPLLGGSHKNNSQSCPSVGQKKPAKSTVIQQVMSAKMLKFKQLQNQLADAHYHLNELANENRLLKALQKRQDSALKRYEGTNAELPRILNSHHEELRVLQIKYKKLKTLHKETCNLLKEKEEELHCLQAQNKHLLQLSKDKNLQEREKLQMQVSDLSYEIQQHHETIQTLQKKISLQNRSMKHQLNLEISRHKETQKHLQETMKKLQNLENLLDNREKRLYSNGQLSINHRKEKDIVSYSLTNLTDTSISTISGKPSNSSKKSSNDIRNERTTPLVNLGIVANEKPLKFGHVTHPSSGMKTETMESLHLVRKFKLQKPSQSPNTLCHTESVMNINRTELEDDKKLLSKSLDRLDFENEFSEQFNKENHYDSQENDFDKLIREKKIKKKYRLPEELKEEFKYTIEELDESERSSHTKENLDEVLTHVNSQRSRELHQQLIGSTDDSSSTDDDEVTNSSIKSSLFAPNLINKCHIQETNGNEKTTLLLVEESSRKENDTISLHNTDMRMITSEDKFNPEYKNKITVELFKNEKLQNKTESESSFELLENICKHNVLQSISKNSLNNDKQETDNFIQPSLKEEYNNNSEKNTETDNPIENQKGFDITCTNNQNTEKIIINDECNKNNVHSDHNKIDLKSEFIYEDTLKLENINSIDGTETYENNVGIKNDGTSSMSNMEKDHDITSLQNLKEPKLDKNNCSTSPSDNKYMSTNSDTRVLTFNKEKLLATMKAIDNNENIELIDQHNFEKPNLKNRVQITENLFRGLPTHAKSKHDVIRDIFGDSDIKNKPHPSCGKLH